MVDEINENDFFSTALKHVADKLGRGCQTSLAIDTGLEDGYISQLKTGKRKASVKTQIKIAKALGYRHIEFLSLGRSLSIGERTDIHLRDIAVARNQQSSTDNISEQPSSYIFNTLNKADKYKVIAEVGEILDSGNADIINALVKNVQEFKRAVETEKRLNIFEVELKDAREEIAELRKQVDRLDSSSIGSDQKSAS